MNSRVKAIERKDVKSGLGLISSIHVLDKRGKRGWLNPQVEVAGLRMPHLGASSDRASANTNMMGNLIPRNHML